MQISDVFKNENDKCKIYTSCPYKKVKTCSGKNLQTIVETVP
jgi:hypothetical protein